ncbi:hypothetical protein [Streptomyces sp. NPDC050121]|uniref:hypothetical protein n=1 Tax=Streptomyces sp. NPDC050121 TaxID=3365601 RepID=UPI0037A8532E
MQTGESAAVVTPRSRPSLRMRLVCAWLTSARTKRILADEASTEADRRRNRAEGPAVVPRRLLRTHDVTVHHRDGLRCAAPDPQATATSAHALARKRSSA